MTPEEKVAELETMVEFLYYWVIRQDERLRHLVAQHESVLAEKRRNDEAFAYKWERLHDTGACSPLNPEHRNRLRSLASEYTGLPSEWFAEKRVLDAGCGDGRMSWAFCELGAEVTAIDIVERGVARTQEVCAGYTPFQAFQWDLLDPLPTLDPFDLTFSFGVLHCTGDTAKGMANLAAATKPGGYMSIMVYGYPRLGHVGDFRHMVKKERYRQMAKGLSFEELHRLLLEKEGPDAARGWFDAVTPQVEDHYLYEQVVSLFHQNGFSDVRRLKASEMRNLIVVGQKR